MNYSTQHQQIALTFLSGIGSKRARILISHFNDLEQFFTDKKLNLAKIPGIPADFVSYKLRALALEESDKVIQYLSKINAETHFFTDDNYPRRLKQCADAPLLLYSKGTINWNPEKIVGIVGTRHATEYGRKLTQDLVEGLQPTGATIVSGMAYGIDICAHQAALKNNLPTWGVLGHGLDSLYPSAHQKIANSMLETGGLISEFHPGQKPEPSFFPMRNRIVAGLIDALIVVESGVKGGSLITANLANDYNRDVFAYPGDVNKPYSMGCLKLIQQDKAHLITSPKDVLKMMEWLETKKSASTQRNLFVELNEIEEKIVTTLRTKSDFTLDVLCYLTTLTTSEASSNLLNLEFKGVVKSLPGRRFSAV